MLVADGAGLRRLAERSGRALALLRALRVVGQWPPVVPAIVLADCLSGDVERDRALNRFLRCCEVVEDTPAALARRAAWLRTAAGRGTAAEALVVALAEPGGAVLTAGSGPRNVEALALFADNVMVERAP